MFTKSLTMYLSCFTVINLKNFIDKYRKGEEIKTPKGIKSHNFRRIVRIWSCLEELYGSEILQHKQMINCNAKEKLDFVSRVNIGQKMRSSLILSGGFVFLIVKDGIIP